MKMTKITAIEIQQKNCGLKFYQIFGQVILYAEKIVPISFLVCVAQFLTKEKQDSKRSLFAEKISGVKKG